MAHALFGHSPAKIHGTLLDIALLSGKSTGHNSQQIAIPEHLLFCGVAAKARNANVGHRLNGIVELLLEERGRA